MIQPLLVFNVNTVAKISKSPAFRDILSSPTKQDSFQRNKQPLLPNSIAKINAQGLTSKVITRSGILEELVASNIENHHVAETLSKKLLDSRQLRSFFYNAWEAKESEINSHYLFRRIADTTSFSDDDFEKFETYQNIEIHHTDYIKAFSKIVSPKYDYINSRYVDICNNIKVANELFRKAFNGSTGDRAILRPRYLASEAGGNVLLGNVQKARELAREAIREHETQFPLFKSIQLNFTVFKDNKKPWWETQAELIQADWNKISKEALYKLYQVAKSDYHLHQKPKDNIAYLKQYCNAFLKLPDDNPMLKGVFPNQ